jgi:hypothetical protein
MILTYRRQAGILETIFKKRKRKKRGFFSFKLALLKVVGTKGAVWEMTLIVLAIFLLEQLSFLPSGQSIFVVGHFQVL